MNKYSQMLFAAMFMVFGVITVCQAKAATPSIEILAPKGEQIVHMGEQAVISWKIRNPPTPRSHWRVYALLYGCHEGMGTFQIYSGPFNKASGQIKWTPPQGILTAQTPDMRWYVAVQLYDLETEGDFAVGMAQSCHAIGGDWLVEGITDEPVVRIER